MNCFNLAEIVKTNDEQPEKESSSSSSSLFSNVNTSTPARLFGQFKPNGTGFSNFGQLTSNGDSSSPTTTTGYFTSSLSKFSSTNGGGGGGFGSSSTSLAASLAPLSSKYEITKFVILLEENIFSVTHYLVNRVHRQKKMTKMKMKKMILMIMLMKRMKQIKTNLHYLKQLLNMKLNVHLLIPQQIFKVIHQPVKSMKSQNFRYATSKSPFKTFFFFFF
jgi:hypothetical protein